MSVAGSTSSRGTHSRSRSRSRSPPYNDGRYMPPRYSSRYDSYSYRPRSAMSNAIDDYRELRDRDRDRDRDRGRDRLPLNMRDDRYISRGRDRDNRYPPRYYRDDLPPPHHYPPSSIPREYPKPSSSGSVRRDTSSERIKDSKNVAPTNFNKDVKEDIRMGNNGPDTYTPPPPRYNDWHRDRDRDRDRERDRRYRDDWRDMDMRSRDRDSYMMRYDNSGYGPPPPLAPPSLSMSYAPFGGDSYRPDRDRDRDMPPSPGGPHLPYYDRDRIDDREFYRHAPRNGPMDTDRYRGRPARSWGPNSSPAPSTIGPIKGGRVNDRDREREGSVKSPRSATSASGVPPWAPAPSSSAATTPTTQRPGRDDIKSDDMERSSGFENPESESAITPKRGNTPDRKENDRMDFDQLSTTTTSERPSPPPSSTTSEIVEPVNTKSESKSESVPQQSEGINDRDEEVKVKKEYEEQSTIREDMNALPTSSIPPSRSEDSIAEQPKLESDKTPLTTTSDATYTTNPEMGKEVPPQQPQQPPTTATASKDISSSTPATTETTNKDISSDTPAITNTPNKNISSDTPAVTKNANKDIPSDIPTTATTSTDVSSDTPAGTIDMDAPMATATEKETQHVEESKSDTNKQMTQQEIVERIDQIENDITMYEEMLEQMDKNEEETVGEIRKETNGDDEERGATLTTAPVDVTGGEEAARSLSEAAQEQKEREEEEAARQQALQVISEETSRAQPMADIENLSSLKASPVMRKRPQLLINQVRSNDETDDLLSEKLIADNRKIAKENSKMIGGWQGKPDTGGNWSDEEEWAKPLYRSIEEFPCYKENVKNFDKVRVSVADSMADHNKKMKKKELRLKKEFRERYEDWKKRNISLDIIRDHERRASEKYTYRSQSRRRVEEESDELVDGVVFNGDSDALRFSADGPGNNYGGPAQNAWTSDAARSEAELLEIIQSLESADMRNPELRAAKTTATIPSMILDEKERMRTFDDRRGLVMDPLTYYHTGPETEDHWTQQEMTNFMESYMQYPKQFDKIAAAVKTKSAPQCVLFYYRKKTKIDFKALVSKGRRGKAGKRRDRLAEAIRRATGTSTTRKGKSKGSALMTDIGEAQVSRKAKQQKETERKSRELRELEEANAYWDGVHERRRTKRPGPTPSASTPTNTAQGSPSTVTNSFSSSATGEELDKGRGDKRRLPRRTKGRSPRGSVGGAQAVPSDTTIIPPSSNSNTNNPESGDEMDSSERNVATTAKWTDEDKKAAIEAFKVHGRNFTHVATLVGTKTEDQCRNFYHNYKRKYGPNAFDEESEAPPASPSITSTSAVVSAPVAVTTSATLTPLPSATIDAQPTAAANDTTVRPDLKAEEEDAAAALMGMCRMGATTPPATSTSTKPTQGHTRTLSTQMDEKPRSSVSSTTNVPGQRRRRARTSSGKAVDSDVMEAWMEAEFSASRPTRRPGRPPGTTMSSDAAKRPAYSSYWTVSEKSELIRCLEKYGCDWEKVANILTSKTATQVRNFYVNNEEKMQLDEVVKRYERAHHQQQQQQQQPSATAPIPPTQSQQIQPQQRQPTPQAPPPPLASSGQSQPHHLQEPARAQPGSYDESSKAHFRVLQNLPFPQPVATEQPTYTSPAMGSASRVGYYTPSPPAPPPPPTQVPPGRQPMHSYHGPPPPGYSSLHPHPPPGPQSSPPSRSATVSPYPPHPLPQSQHHHTTTTPPHPPQPYSHIHPDRPSHSIPSSHQQQRRPPHLTTSMSETASSSVTKVADLLNSDEPSDSTNQNNNWESWFS